MFYLIHIVTLEVVGEVKLSQGTKFHGAHAYQPTIMSCRDSVSIYCE